MLAQIFKSVLITSLAGSFLAVVITLLRPAAKRIFGYLRHYCIWLIVYDKNGNLLNILSLTIFQGLK